VAQGRIVPPRGGNRTSLFLFLLTVMSVLFVGANMAINEIAATNPRRADMLEAHFWTELWRGWPYALSILLILGAHEMGHYVMARRHHIAVSPPYFLPFPFGPFGTMGATIRMHQPARNRKILLDISAAGPLAGLAVAVPILLIGLANSRIGPVSEGLAEGNSIAYAAAKVIAIGHYLPDGMDDVHVNQMAWAGWIGLFITSLHLIPIGQLDGGNVLYALMGRYARFAHFPALAALVIMVLVSSGVFLFIAVLLLFLGRVYAVPLDDITPLNPTRRWIGVLILAIFVLVFVPVPLRRIVVEAGNPVPGFNAGVVLLWMWLAYNRLRWRGLQPPV
jgi:membrane-associated protease RseP (regulator of RpoE activity)